MKRTTMLTRITTIRWGVEHLCDRLNALSDLRDQEKLELTDSENNMLQLAWAALLEAEGKLKRLDSEMREKEF